MFLNNINFLNEAESSLEEAMGDEETTAEDAPTEEPSDGAEESDSEENTEEDSTEDEQSNNATDDDSSPPDGEEDSSDSETDDEMGDSSEEGMDDEGSEENMEEEEAESQEEKLEKVHFFNSFSKMSETLELFMEKMDSIIVEVSSMESKNDLRIINNELTRLYEDVNELLLNRIKFISVKNLKGLSTIFQTKTETLVQLVEKIIEVKRDE